MTRHFPRLTPANHRTTSPRDDRYNCLAWAVGEDFRWWQPEFPYYWPLPDDPDAESRDGLMRAYAAVGFFPADDGGPEPGYEKVAIYADADGRYTHASRLLTDGRWTSKLGFGVDIAHDTPDAVAGGLYGEVFGYMRRPLPPG